MSDNPFASQNNNQRTEYARPTPGGQSFAPPQRQPAEPPPSPAPPATPLATPLAGDTIGPLATGQSALIVAATPLLRLLGRIRNTFTPPDPADLRNRTLRAIQEFETEGRAAGLPHEVLHPARYALCASIDDMVLHTPWGAASTYVQATLVGTLHQENISGERFFHQLDALKREPARNFMLLELMYFCLALGYQGQYRLSRQGPAQLEQIREDLYQTLVRLRPRYEMGLSPHWMGVEAPYRPARATVPIWVMAVVAVAVVMTTWGILLERLYAFSDLPVARANQMPPLQMPGLVRPQVPGNTTPPPPAVQAARKTEPAIMITLRRFLQPEIDSGQVILKETPTMVRVRVYNGGMFASGSATVRPDFESLLERIGEALNQEPGIVLVTGHTDRVPIRTFRFPSNLQLSLARAQAAQAILARRLRDPGRLSVSGVADSEPLGNDETEQGREMNRRIEVILRRPEIAR